MSSKMLTYILKRFLMALLTIFLVIAITFFVMHAIPASPFSSEKAKSDALIAKQTEAIQEAIENAGGDTYIISGGGSSDEDDGGSGESDGGSGGEAGGE